MYNVYYQKASDRLDFFSERKITIDEIEETHVKVAAIPSSFSVRTLDDVYAVMNGARTQPNPLATENGQVVLKSKGVKHTSMSINDVIHIDDKWFQCASLGWNELA